MTVTTRKSSKPEPLAANQKKFQQRRNRIVRQIDQKSEASVRQALRRLDQLRRRILDQLKSTAPLEDNIPLMRQTQRMIEQDIRSYGRDLTSLVQKGINEGWQRGQELITQPARVFVPGAISGPVTAETLAIAQAFSADLIQGLTADIRAKINSILRRMVLGGLDQRQAQREVGRSLTSKGAFRSLAYRAETIVRTEILRIHSEATQLQMEQQSTVMEQAGYEMKKSWLATMDKRTRDTHRAADKKYDEKHAIAVDEYFIVGGEEALYPRDPSLSAAEAINCRCTSIPVVSRITATKKAA